jgi:hypothetical protein
MNTTPSPNTIPTSSSATAKSVEMPKAKKVLAVEDEDSGKFEIAIRLLSNEIFALSISANPFNKRWIVYSLITMGFLLFAVSAFGDSIVSFSTGMYDAINAQ